MVNHVSVGADTEDVEKLGMVGRWRSHSRMFSRPVEMGRGQSSADDRGMLVERLNVYRSYVWNAWIERGKIATQRPDEYRHHMTRLLMRPSVLYKKDIEVSYGITSDLHKRVAQYYRSREHSCATQEQREPTWSATKVGSIAMVKESVQGVGLSTSIVREFHGNDSILLDSVSVLLLCAVRPDHNQNARRRAVTAIESSRPAQDKDGNARADMPLRHDDLCQCVLFVPLFRTLVHAIVVHELIRSSEHRLAPLSK